MEVEGYCARFTRMIARSSHIVDSDGRPTYDRIDCRVHTYSVISIIPLSLADGLRAIEIDQLHAHTPCPGRLGCRSLGAMSNY